MKLTGIHLLLSYRCTDECDHCFLWGSPQARGTMTLDQIRDVMHQIKELGTVETVYFEGGEPFLFYPILLQGLQEAAAMGFRRGVVSNCYWATSVEDATEWLRPIAGIGVDDLSLSSDLFHGEAMMTRAAQNGIEAAGRLGLPDSVLSIEAPEGCAAYEQDKGTPRTRGAPIEGSPVRFRGRAVANLTEGVTRWPWRQFTECPDEDFYDPGRVHVDAFGHVHLCQGVLMGNLWQQPLTEMLARYDPANHPIIGPLAEGGPVALVERYNLPHEETYIDACHLCYLARDALRSLFPEYLGPPTVYGEL
jgi:hypothetical protein